MSNLKCKTKSILSLLLAVCMMASIVPTAVFAAQSNEYVDPADNWLSSNNRTNELDVNATVTNETQWCTVCNKQTGVMTYRVPEYTKTGETALNRGVKFSDGTLIGGTGKGNLDNGTPGIDAFYTGYHFTKTVCGTCGTINTVDGPDAYNFNNNVYGLNSCDHNFFLDFDATTHELYDEDYHLTTLKRGEYCKFCKGTFARASRGLEKHDFAELVDAQLGNNRFYLKETCADCGFETSEYVTAKSVITSYYGEVDGDAHTLTVADLSDRGVKTSILYGNSADSCTKTSAPNYTKAGYYTVYYKINYSYAGETMTENGVSYIWLVDNGKNNDNGNNNDTVIVIPPAHHHDYHYLETVNPSCNSLGYERWQCEGCGNLEKRNYTQATGHSYKAVTVREATCKQGGLKLNLCSKCGDFYEETTPTVAHSYKVEKHDATCRKTGYNNYICEICGDNYIIEIEPIIAHSFKGITKEPTCTDKGYTTFTCEMCDYHYVSDYTEPTGHAWDKGHTVTNSTCEAEGVIEFNCTNKGCTEKMIKATNANGHTPGKAATCTEPQRCTVCDTVLELPTGHSYEGKVTNPTCTSMGYTTYNCKDCNDSYIADYTDKAAHEYVENVTAPTCTEHGFTTYSCKNCDDEYISDYTEKLNHNYKAEITKPTCTAMGYTTFVCADCGDTYKADYVDMLEHNYNKQTIEPTCTEHGYAIYTCPDCGKEFIADYTDIKQHSYNAVVTEPTCTAMGYTTYTCTDCGDSYKADYKDALGHTLSDWIIDTAATIEHSGSKHIECTVCGETLQTAEIPQLADKDNSDEDGKAQLGAYSIILTDKNGKPIFNSEISIDINDKISIKLPDNRLLDYADQTTITAFYTDTQAAKADLHIFIYDEMGNAATGKTDADGQLKVPNDKSSTGDDNGTIGKDDGEVKTTFVVTVTDKTNAVIPNCDVYIGESNNLVVDLPEGVKPTKEYPVIITVTDQNGNAQTDITVIALGTADYIEKGKTDIYGKVTLPITNEGFTDDDGKVNVEQRNVIVNDELSLISNAYVVHNEDGTISVTLPENKNISYANRTTVTVLDSIGKPIEGVSVTVNDNAENTYTATTNADGKIIVPSLDKDYTDTNGYAEVDGYIVTVTNARGAIEKAYIIHNAEVKNEDGTVKTAENITITLPENLKFDYKNRVTVKVQTKADETAVKDMAIIISELAEADAEPKVLTDKTNAEGVAVFPPLSEDITDNDGNSNITEEKPGKGEDTDGDGKEDKPGETVTTTYNVKVNDTKGIITGSFIEIKDGKVYVTLPDTHTLTTSNQTTVTVTDKDNKAVQGVSVTVKDKTTEKTATTNANGQITVPVKTSSGGSSSGGSSRPSSGGGGGSYISSNATNITVTDKDGKTVSVSKSTDGKGNVTLTLPNGKDLADGNYYTVKATDNKGNAKADVNITLKDKKNNSVNGITDKNGMLTLPGKNHKAYIVGYDDGTFRPDSDMSRAEAAAIFARLIAAQKGENISGKSNFTDVSTKAWYSSSVGYLAKYDVVKGYSDGTFKPDAPVTRAEFVAMTVRYYGLFNDVKKTGYTVNYTDLEKSNWAYSDIAYAKNIGWLNGYADGTFKGDNNITRAEVVTVVNRATGRAADKEYVKDNFTKLNRFTDVADNGIWYFWDIMESANTHMAVTSTDNETWVK